MTRQKILLVDDDPEVVEAYKGLLEQIPSKPEIHTASSGARALAMLERANYRMLLCDLQMPRMDGLQVLSIVRRKYPMVRTVVLTGIVDEQFRSRVYGIGVDLYWHKPSSEQEITQFLDCCESLLGAEDAGGFRGVQSKSLMDIIQLECMSQASSLLRINNGTALGRIWIQDGEVVDAETGDLRGEEAFLKIFAWATGSFETQQAEPSRQRTIFKPYNSLLLESAQALDENRSREAEEGTRESSLLEAAQIDGIEFVLASRPSEEKPAFAAGIEDPAGVARWARRCLESFEKIGDCLHTGQLVQISARGPQRELAVLRHNGAEFCIGWQPGMARQQARNAVQKVLSLWVS